MLILMSARGGWGWEYCVCGAFGRLRSEPSLGGIWAGVWRILSRPATLGFGPCGSLAKQRQFGNPQGP